MHEGWRTVSGIFWCCREQSDGISRHGINLQDCAALCMHHLSLMIVNIPGQLFFRGILRLWWSHMRSIVCGIRMRCVRAVIARPRS